MDYGYVPGIDPPEGQRLRLIDLFRRRDQTRLVPVKSIGTVKQLVKYLTGAGSILRPIGSILIGAHSGSDGTLKTPLFPGQKGDTTYETLVDSLSAAAKSVKIEDSLIGYPGSSDPHSVHIKGCNLGQSYQFMLKLKEAFGGHVSVTAPKHFHGIDGDIVDGKAHGSLEFMAYEFVVRSKNNLDRDDLLAALKNRIFGSSHRSVGVIS